jgi:hypothetical protein
MDVPMSSKRAPSKQKKRLKPNSNAPWMHNDAANLLTCMLNHGCPPSHRVRHEADFIRPTQRTTNKTEINEHPTPTPGPATNKTVFPQPHPSGVPFILRRGIYHTCRKMKCDLFAPETQTGLHHRHPRPGRPTDQVTDEQATKPPALWALDKMEYESSESLNEPLAGFAGQDLSAPPRVEEEVLTLFHILHVDLAAAIGPREDAVFELSAKTPLSPVIPLLMGTYLAGVNNCRQYRKLIRTPCSAILSTAASVSWTPSVVARMRTIRLISSPS